MAFRSPSIDLKAIPRPTTGLLRAGIPARERSAATKGTFNLGVVGDCMWTTTVRAGPGTLSLPATFSSSQTGSNGSTQQFTTSSPWTMGWSYYCNDLGLPGFFNVVISQPAGDPTVTRVRRRRRTRVKRERQHRAGQGRQVHICDPAHSQVTQCSGRVPEHDRVRTDNPRREG